MISAEVEGCWVDFVSFDFGIAVVDVGDGAEPAGI